MAWWSFSVKDGIDLARSLINWWNTYVGICLGHQIFGLAWGYNIWLPFGPGLNHPCGMNNQIEITSQNHGFNWS